MNILGVGSIIATAAYQAAMRQAMVNAGHQFIISLDNPAADWAKQNLPDLKFLQAGSNTPDQLIGDVKPDHIMVCLAGGGLAQNPWEWRMALEAQKRGIPFSIHEDMSPTVLDIKNLPMFDKINPAQIFVAEQMSKDMLTEKGIAGENLIAVAGNPTWDEMAEFETKAARIEVRSKMGLKDTDKLVIFMGSKFQHIVCEELDWTIAALNSVANQFGIIMGTYYHPACPDWKANPSTTQAPHGAYQAPFNALDKMIRVLNDPELRRRFKNQLEVLAAADLVFSWGSTLTLNTAQMSIPTVRLFTPENEKKAETAGFPRPYRFPAVASGCQYGANNLYQLIQVMPLLLDSKSELVKTISINCAANYPRTGLVAQNIVKAIEALH